MIKKNNKKFLFKRILAFGGAVFCTIVCAFNLFNYSDTKSMEVSADEIVVTNSVFVGSPILVPSAGYAFTYTDGNRKTAKIFTDADGNSTWCSQSYAYSNYFSSQFMYLFSLFSVDLRVNQDTGVLEFKLHVSYYDLYDSQGYQDNTGKSATQPYSYLYYMASTIDNFEGYSLQSWLPLSELSGGSLLSVSLYDYLDGDFSETPGLQGLLIEIYKSSTDIDIDNIVSCRLSLDKYYASSNRTKFILRYLDKNNNYIDFLINCGNSLIDYPSRTYYLKDNYNFTDNEYYNMGKQEGDSVGFNRGYSEGKKDGFKQGEEKGLIDGYIDGYQKGTDDSGTYTFLSLVSSVIDAPMTYFTSLFNFELLGVNLQGFLMALFTLCVIVTLVKLCVGG